MTGTVPPGSTIGILGGGQLGRMLALAAARLGLRCHVYAPDADSPAFDVAAARTVAAYDDAAALNAFAEAVDVATYEFENIPLATVELLAARVTVRPGAKALACAQDRLNEKRLACRLGAGTATFEPIDSLADLDRALDGSIPPPAVLKTRRLGYDGKGQAKIIKRSDAAAAWSMMAGQPSILESFVPFRAEMSVIAARGADGDFRAFDITENEHRNHILHRSLAPARVSAEATREALALTQRVAVELDYVGVLAIELFAVREDEHDRLLVNEMAPRVHNSGHWTQDGAETCQFEQHIRAVAGWPLGSTRRLAPFVEMVNLIANDAASWASLAAEPGAHLHLYGKREAKPGRKMGHVNRLLQSGDG